MAIDGKRFLKVSKAHCLVIGQHALDRIREKTGSWVSIRDAYRWFEEGTQLTHEELRQMVFRPAYISRKKHGVDSWYFKLKSAGMNLIAVLQPGEEPGDVEWVTTYALNRQR